MPRPCRPATGGHDEDAVRTEIEAVRRRTGRLKRDLVLHASVTVDRKGVDLVRPIGHKQRPPVRAEGDLSRIGARFAQRSLNCDEPLGLEHEAHDAGLSACVEHVHAIAVDGNAARRRSARLRAIAELEPVP